MMSMQRLRVLVAGVSFGCHNVSDEAIIERNVNLLREQAPGCQITASTGMPEATAELLDVQTCPLLGFPPKHQSRSVR